MPLPHEADYYDISPLVCERTAVFPGDRPFSREVAMAFDKGDHLALSSIRTTVHIGAHVDAPSHFHPQGETMEKRRLDDYLGPCEVITVRLGPNERILPEHLSSPVRAPRVLFKTRSFPDPMRWTGDFNALSPELIDWLAGQGVRLVGIDTPSVDPAESKALESHQALFRNRMANLEGVVLDSVPDGVYTLIALPLRIEGADGSPVRAALWRGELAPQTGTGIQ